MSNSRREKIREDNLRRLSSKGRGGPGRAGAGRTLDASKVAAKIRADGPVRGTSLARSTLIPERSSAKPEPTPEPRGPRREPGKGELLSVTA